NAKVPRQSGGRQDRIQGPASGCLVVSRLNWLHRHGAGAVPPSSRHDCASEGVPGGIFGVDKVIGAARAGAIPGDMVERDSTNGLSQIVRGGGAADLIVDNPQ